MLLKVPCFNCSDFPANRVHIVSGVLQRSGVVLVDCDKGHKTAIIYRAPKYDVLLLSGALALLDGYYNAAISTLSAALERTHEYYMRLTLKANGVPQATFDALWKEVRVQSERQLGAFQFVYAIHEGAHLRLDADIARIRNSVVHQGEFASATDAEKFGSLVFERIRSVEAALAKHPEILKAHAEEESDDQKRAVPEGRKWMEMTVFNVKVDRGGRVVGQRGDFGFDEYLEALRQGRRKGWR